MEIEREVLVQKTRLLGAEHESTLILPDNKGNLVCSLLLCDHKTEAEQLLREMLAPFLRALGPTHEVTQGVLENLRALGLAA